MFTARRTNIARAVPWHRPINWRHPHARGLVGHWMPSLCRYNLNLLDLTRRNNATLTNMDASNYVGSARGLVLDHNGTNERVTLGAGYHPFSTHSVGAMACRFKLKSSGIHVLMGVGDTSTSLLWLQARTDSNWPGEMRLCVLQRSHGGGISGYAGNTNIIVGRDYHAVLSSDGSSWALYVDGVDDGPLILAIGSDAQNGDWFADTTPTNPEIIFGGALNQGSYIHSDVQLDDIRIYNRALSAAEIWNIAHEPWPAHLNVLGARRVVSAPQAAVTPTPEGDHPFSAPYRQPFTQGWRAA